MAPRFGRRATRIAAVAAIVGAITFSQAASASSVVAYSRGAAPAPADRAAYSAAQALTRRLLATFPRRPGAVLDRRSPISSLDQPPESLASDQLVTSTAWFTAPGNVGQLGEFYTDHHGALSLESSGQDGGDGTVVDDLEFGGPSTSYAWAPEVTVAFVPDGRGVAVRIDATAVWRAPHPAAETIVGAISVTVTLTRPSLPTRRGTVSGAAAAHLAAIINSLPTYPAVEIACPLSAGDDAFRFTTTLGTLDVDDGLGGCGSVDFAGAQYTALPGLKDDTDELDRAVVQALGLPLAYFAAGY